MRLSKIGLPLAAVLLLSAVSGWLAPSALAHAWLTVTLIFGLLPLGALAWLMCFGLTGGQWGTRTLPLWQALASTLPLLVVSLLALLPFMDTLFPWTAPVETLPEVVRHKTLYLNTPFFVIRLLLYAVIWLGLAYMQGLWGQRGRHQGAGHAPGLVIWLLSLTFFGFDWFMSLEPRFYSDVFGLTLGANAMGAAMAVVVLFGAAQVTEGVRQDLSGLWISALLGWVFLAFSQFIIIWSGNLPHEIGWYVHRSEGIWRAVSVLSFGLFSVIPFAALLSRSVRTSARGLMVTAVLCLAGHGLRIAWLILPAFEGETVLLWLIPLLLVTVGATYWVWMQEYGRSKQQVSREAAHV
ncbi:hypothetical protein QQM79_00095 [Marinobacteraceae bacterium S3BR75-40.1]